MFYGLYYEHNNVSSFVPQNSYVEVLPPKAQKVVVFGDRVFKEVTKLK
jgi:hypothetical protein